MQQHFQRRSARFLMLALVVLTTLKTYGQVPTFQDCLGATPICLGTYSYGNLVTGTGNIPNEINPATSCLLTGERNDVWYIITTGSAGTLSFSIVPNNLAHNYDWAVYHLTTNVCADIFTNPSLEVACNYSNTPGITGPNGLVGAQNNPVIPVLSQQTYLINVSAYSSFQQSGYTIDLSASTANIIDNTPPTLSGVTSMVCGASAMIVRFSERILCNTVQAGDFTLTGPGGPYTITAVSSSECTSGAAYSRDYTLSFSPSISLPGSYTLSLAGTVTDLCSNVSTLPQSLQIPISGVNLNLLPTNVTCYSGNNGSITANVSGAPGPYTYQWSPLGGSGATAQGLAAGTYTVTVTSAMGCSATASVTITQPLTGITASVVTTPANGCANNGSATVTPANGQPPYTYSWWPTGGNAATATGLSAGAYMVTITDAFQCVLNYFLNVPSASGPSIAITNTTDVSCYGGNDGSATVGVSNATGPFQYLWSPTGGTGSTANGLTAGNYSVQVIVAPGCTLTAATVIVEPPMPLSVSVNTTPTSCGNSNGAITVNASGGAGSYTYQWTPNITSGNSASSLAGGTYSVTVTDGNGCSQTETINIPTSTQPAITLTGHLDVSCNGLSDGATGININGGAPPINVLWSNGQTSATLNNLPAGTYTVTVTDAFGCSASLTDIINQPTPLNASVQNVTHVKCYGDTTGAITVSSSGGNSGHGWTWSGVQSTGTTVSNLPAGSYVATVTDLMGCSAVVNITINEPVAPLSVQGTIVPTSCGNNDGSITTQTGGGTAPYIYQWNTSATSPGLTSIGAGVYSITITDANGCSLAQSFTVQASNAPQVSVVSLQNVNCNGAANGSATLQAVGGIAPYTWSWQGNSSTGPSATGLAAGTYIITVTDASGCVAISQVTITQPDPIQITVSTSPTICIGENATLSATVQGGTAPYNYSWNNGAGGGVITVNPVITTTYTVAVTDANGCLSSAQQVTVTVNDPLSVVATFPDSICKGLEAFISIAAAGGDGNYSYSWSNGMSGATQSITINQNLNLTITVTDGCTTPAVQAAVVITAVSAPDVNMTLDPQAGCVPLEAQFTVPTNFPAGLLYYWDFGNGFTSQQATPSHTYINPGIFDVTLTVAYASAPGCSTTLSFPQAVRAYALPMARFIYGPPAPTLSSPEVFFNDRSTGATYWSWNFGDGHLSSDQNPRHSYRDTGSYVVSLLVTGPEGCRDSTAELLNVRDEMIFFVPNAFTPDGSGVNDYFNVYGVGIAGYEMEIYDRWGKRIYVAKNSDRAWDGTDMNTGQRVPQGLYVYKVTVTDRDGKTQRRVSQVTVIR